MKGPKEQQQENVPVTNAFELQRQQRIQRNKRVLCELGLETAGQQLVAAPAKRSKPRAPKEQQQPLEPSRKSRRLQGDKPELQPIAGRWDAAAFETQLPVCSHRKKCRLQQLQLWRHDDRLGMPPVLPPVP